jgi:hypothetical protein
MESDDHARSTGGRRQGTLHAQASAELGRVREVLRRHRGATRTALARAVCQELGWRSANGAPRVRAARDALVRLAERGAVRLPPRRSGGARPPAAPELAQAAEPPLAERPAVPRRVVVRPVEPGELPAFRAALERHHYLGDARLVGESVRHVAEVDGRWVALLGWAAAALKSRHREAWIGWDEATKTRRLHLVANNVRFLVLPGAHVPHLASAVLARSTRRLSRDFEACYGHPVLVAETFVDVERFRGTCYLAAGWTRLGLTRGMARSGRGYQHHGRKKALFVLGLERRAREMLAAPMLPPAILRRMAMAKLPAVEVDVNQVQMEGKGGLLGVLSEVPDPRDRRGLRHRFEGVLAAVVMAKLSGMQSYEAIAEWVADLPREVCRRLGFYCWKPPSEPTIRRVLQSVDADALDRVVGAWLAAQTTSDGVALDGKTLRGSHDGERPAVHLLAAVTHGDCVVVTQRGVQEKSNEIPGAAPLLADVDLSGKTVTADAMHTQVELAEHLVEERGADYVLTVKANQPKLLAQLQAVAWESLPPSGQDARPRPRAGGAAHGPADR